MNNEIEINLDDMQLMPTRAHPHDAGLDLRASETTHVMPGGLELVDTGVAFKIPVGYVGLVFARSSMSKIDVAPANCVGVIDSDYRGTVKVRLANRGTSVFNIAQYDRIAQLVILPILRPNLLVVNKDEWLDTTRGVGGFGSTGVR